MKATQKGSSKWVLAVAGALILGFLLKKSCSRSEHSQNANQTQTQTQNQQSGQGVAPDKKEAVELIDVAQPTLSSNSLQKIRQQSTLQIELGLQVIPSTETNDKINFQIATKIFASGCTSGDFDLIKAIANDYKAKEFLISLEPLQSHKSEGFKVRVSLGDITNGKHLAIVLPKAMSTGSDYGLYLCRDSANTNQCGKKKPLGPRYWAGVYRSKADNDKILYYAMVTVRDAVVYLIPGKNLNEPVVARLKKTLKSVLEQPDSLDEYRRNFQELSSVPPHVGRDALELPLPYKHPHCL